MYEFHGWATIHESVKEKDEGNLDQIVKRIQEYITQIEWFNTRAEAFWVNRKPLFSISGYRNHKSGIASDLFSVFEFIAKLAPGSYGILYIRDDEEVNHENEFQVYVLARGKLRMLKDPFLSPFVPTIEDYVSPDEV